MSYVGTAAYFMSMIRRQTQRAFLAGCYGGVGGWWTKTLNKIYEETVINN